MDDKWTTLRTVLKTDAEALELEARSYETQGKLTLDKAMGDRFRSVSYLLAIQAGAILHCIDVMEQIERQNDGGSELNKVEA